MSGRTATVVKVLISIALIALLFYRVDVGTVLAALRGTHFGIFLLAMVLYLGAIGSNALKWGMLLRAQGVNAPLSSVFRHTFVGVFFNNFMPFIGADMIRGYGLVREVSSTTDVAVSVLVDRLIGLMVFTSAATVSALVAVRFVAIDEPALVVVEQIGILLTVALGGGFLLLLSGRLRRMVERIVGRIPLLAPLVPIVAGLSSAVGSYRSQPASLIAAYGIGLATIVLSNLVNWLLFSAIGSGIPLLFIFIFNPIIGLTMALPISIAGLGVNQHIFPALYSLVGSPEGMAVAASLLLQLIIAVTSLPGGVIWMIGRSRHSKHPSTPPPAERPVRS